MKRFLIAVFSGLVWLNFCLVPSLQASSGKEGASFLDIPVGAGPAALGSAYTALATDAYAPTWNPGGLGFLKGNEMSGQHLSYLDSINDEYFSIVHPLAEPSGSATHSGIGFSMQYLTSGDIPQTDGSDNSLGQFSSHWGSYNVSYGRSLNESLSLGLTGKWINAEIADVSANAFAVDLGGLYKFNERLNLAATLTNMGSKLTFLSSSDSLPLAAHLGFAYELNTDWTVTTEGVFPQNGLNSFHIGAQWQPLEAISLRLGYKTDTLSGLSALAGFTAGIGIHAWGQEFAYAWSPYGDLGNAQYFSVIIHFGAAQENRRNLIQYKAIKIHRTARQEDDPDDQQLSELLSDEPVHMAQTEHPIKPNPSLHERVRPDMRQ